MFTSLSVTAVIPAAGESRRYKSPLKNDRKNKLLENIEDINNLPVIVHTLKRISAVAEIENIIICASAYIIEDIKQLVAQYSLCKVKNVIQGGKTRQESVYFGILEAKNYNPQYILIHDGARPFVSEDLIRKTLSCAAKYGASAAAVPVKDTIKKASPKTKQVIETLDRQGLWSIQTPQVFRFKEILQAHEMLKGHEFTDDAGMIEKTGNPVFLVEGDYRNIKITTAEDIQIARVFNLSID